MRSLALALAIGSLLAGPACTDEPSEGVEVGPGDPGGDTDTGAGQGGDPDGPGLPDPPSSPGPARSPLPILLLHGAAGFDRIGPLEYFFDVADTLERAGHVVFTTEVDPLQTVEVRAAELAAEVDAILDSTGAGRVHLIGHSMGGLDARFLISSLGYGDRVATLTTISTPHLGSRVADIALDILPGVAEEALGFLVDLLAGAAAGSEQDAAGQILQLSEAYAVGTFNPANPDDPRVAYFSVAGVTQVNPFADPLRNDLCDGLLLAGYALLATSGPNDGLVTVASAQHGTFLGTVPADHLDEVGQLLGTTSPAFDHRAFYLALAEFLTSPDAPAPL